MEPTKPNWIERRRQAENHLTTKSEILWRDVKAAIEDAARSFNESYGEELGRKAEVTTTNDHRLRVTVKLLGINQERVTDIDFNREDKSITASYHSPVGTGTAAYRMTADSNGAFLVKGNSQEPIEADDISEQVLEPLLFLTPSIYSKRGLLKV